MNNVKQTADARAWPKKRFLVDVPQYVRDLITPFNLVTLGILIVGLSLIFLRYAQGLGKVTAASQDQPWGLLLTWGLFVGIPLGSSGFVLAAAVYLFGMKQFHPVVKHAILIGFLGYLFAVVSLLIDLGRPWRLPYPMIGAYGTASVLLEVAWCVALYLSCQALELGPTFFKWLGWTKVRKALLSLTIALTILGVILSTLHQSALGAMFLLTPSKLHPLWYSIYLPPLFFVSAIAAGISMVILISAIAKRFFKERADESFLGNLNGITMGLGKAVAFVLVTYFALKIVALAHDNNWSLLATPYGYWYLVELVGFVLIPLVIMIVALKNNSIALVRAGGALTLMGVIINRFNISMIALNWQLPHREFLDWRELLIVLSIVTLEIVLYRWAVNHLPILDNGE